MITQYDAELTVREGENGRTWARIQKPDLTNLTRADTSTILLEVFDVNDPEQAVHGENCTPIEDYLSDALDNQNGPVLGGTNFTAPVPSSKAAVEGGKVYLFRYTFRLRDNTSILWMVGLTVRSTL